jgi:hypothetical protein
MINLNKFFSKNVFLFFVMISLIQCGILKCKTSRKLDLVSLKLIQEKTGKAINDLFSEFSFSDCKIEPFVNRNLLHFVLKKIIKNKYVSCSGEILKNQQALSSKDSRLVIEKYLEELQKVRNDIMNSFKDYNMHIDDKINLLHTFENIFQQKTLFKETISYVVYKALFDKTQMINTQLFKNILLPENSFIYLENLSKEFEKLKIFFDSEYNKEQWNKGEFNSEISLWYIQDVLKQKIKENAKKIPFSQKEIIQKIAYNTFILMKNIIPGLTNQLNNAPHVIVFMAEIIKECYEEAQLKNDKNSLFDKFFLFNNNKTTEEQRLDLAAYNIFLNIIETNPEIMINIIYKSLLWIDFQYALQFALNNQNRNFINFSNNDSIQSNKIIFNNIIHTSLLKSINPITNTIDMNGSRHLFIQGPSSSGKTRLLYSIFENALLEKFFGIAIGENVFENPDIVLDMTSIVNTLKILSLKEDPNNAFSQGKAERVGLAIVLNIVKANPHKKFYLIMDEPFTGLPVFMLKNVLKNDFSHILALDNINIFFNSHIPELQQFVNTYKDAFSIKHIYSDCKEISPCNFVATYQINDNDSNAWFVDPERTREIAFNNLTEQERQNLEKQDRYDIYTTYMEIKQVYKLAGAYESHIKRIFVDPFLM